MKEHKRKRISDVYEQHFHSFQTRHHVKQKAYNLYRLGTEQA